MCRIQEYIIQGNLNALELSNKCSARFDGISINDCLLQGPDLSNGLLGVLCRFREERTAFMMNVKGMFHQFFVPEHQMDLLRFLWWEDGNESKDVIEYRMKLHLFGAASFPGCARVKEGS